MSEVQHLNFFKWKVFRQTKNFLFLSISTKKKKKKKKKTAAMKIFTKSFDKSIIKAGSKNVVIWKENYPAHLISKERLLWNCALTAITSLYK